MKLCASLAALLIFLSSASADNSDPGKVQAAVKILYALCVGGGTRTTWRIDNGANITLESSRGNFFLESREAVGLVDGITNSMSSVAADQANRVRACMQPYVEAIVSAILPPSNERLLDPPILQFGMPIEQFKIIAAGRHPYKISSSDDALQAEGVLLGVSGTILYGFDATKTLSSLTLWNTCIREKFRYPPNVKDVLPEYLDWRTISTGTADCETLLKVATTLRAKYGNPVDVSSPGDCAAMLPTNRICAELSSAPSTFYSGCHNPAAFPSCRLTKYVAKDRQTPISFEQRTYHLRGTLRTQDYDYEVSREFIVGIIGISDPGAVPLKPQIDRGFTIFKYLQ
jgi:hypothetical protein